MCIFCNWSWCYEPLNCRKYPTTEAQKNSPYGNRYCFTCNVFSAVAHLPEVDYCEGNEECVGWYSLEHHTIFCPERVKVFNLFVPKIDQNLFSRFGDFFELDEKYSMLLSSPKAAENANLPKIKISPNFSVSDNTSSDTTIVVNDTLTVSDCNNEKIEQFFDSIFSKAVICLPRKVKIQNSKLSPENVIRLLSNYTKEFYLKDSVCTPNLNFTDIIRNGPNLEVISNYDWDTNIQIDNTWPEDLLKYKKGKNFNCLSFKFGVIEEFDYNKLREFIVKKCTCNIIITLQYAQQIMDDDEIEWDKLNKITKKLYSCMEDKQKNHGDDDDPFIWIGFDGVDGYECISLANCVKKRYIPPRAATKRRYV